MSTDEARVRAIAELVSALVSGVRDGRDVDLNQLKCEISRRYRLARSPKLVEIIAALPEEHRAALLPRLRAKPVRTASGIAVVAVMSKPHRCPHIATTGNICIYCPGGPDSDFEYSTQSYTGYEPTSMRAIRARYDPYVQARGRVDQLRKLGHVVDKVEYILMGGTFMSLPADYRDYFIRNLHDALSGHASSCAVRYSEESRTKCIGLTIETRPDYCARSHLTDMLSYGCTRLEIGLQSIYEDVARDTNRGHTVEAVKQCFVGAKDAGFKVVVHMMPDLPGVGWERDIECFREFFENPDFRTDGLKLYPTLVIRGTGLYELWKRGLYRNYAPDKLVDLVARVLALVPPWVRVYRIQRDIPMPLVTAGVEKGNLREVALARMAALGLRCRDVRTREVGIQEIHGGSAVRPDQVELLRRDYAANGGWETFLAYEDPRQDILVGLLRLRPDSSRQPELLGRVSMVRELHVYGTAVAVHARDTANFQHQGYGSLLMAEAERIARFEHLSTKIAVISGVGTRHYYRKLGYELEGHYMVKHLHPPAPAPMQAPAAAMAAAVADVTGGKKGAAAGVPQPVNRRRRTMARGTAHGMAAVAKAGSGAGLV
ncbi:hypothetical protein VOLCADRAFT_61745 [Volvox carteri f. nagariensis]|uniref:Elongator complex protein 3 n=1 Tax=Volvox carteri f. nagariensis TaxID=3068 RepID=D8TZ51_VOLCA|nr:uncharacterized protein VOLCADRAFT_61745 [Volvox carteri f. nagariensis]EFJ47119.1 hypothetical protein VOLCADRAFT_61745 [Volvox carteri f. nagariensis]|eukprot:XP_002951668.1 hypothetical protein VOLCADRAFT_61745 [Volvox carteri f. nagariensis]